MFRSTCNPAERIAYVLDSSRPEMVLTTSADGFDVPTETLAAPAILVIDELDLSGFDWADCRRRADPTAARSQHGLRHLHVGIYGTSERCLQ